MKNLSIPSSSIPGSEDLALAQRDDVVTVPGIAGPEPDIERNAHAERSYRWFAFLLLAAIACFAVMDALLFSSFLIPDGVSYLDMADAIGRGNWHAVVNGYWNPGYPAVLYLGKHLLDPHRAAEYLVVHCINLGILIAMLACLWFFVCSLAPSSDRNAGWTEECAGDARFTRSGLLVLALIAVLGGIGDAFLIHRVTPDTLLACFIFLAAGLLVRLLRRPGIVNFILLGIVMGLGYLVKEAFFPISAVVVISLFCIGGERKKRVLGTLVTVAMFAAVIFPQVYTLSMQKGRFDYGDTGKLNYLWLVDGVERGVVPPLPGDPSAGLFTHLKHPPRILAESPRIEEFATPVAGTNPLWDDASYWYDGVTVPISIKAQVRRTIVNVPKLLQSIGRDPYLPGVILALLLGGLLAPRSRREILKVWPVLLFAAAFLGIYLLVEVSSRYVAAAMIVLLLTILASVRFRDPASAKTIGKGFLLLAGCLAILAQVALHKEELSSATKHGNSAITQNAYTKAAATLSSSIGLRPGDTVACIGADACTDTYWAREAGVRIIAMAYYPSDQTKNFVESSQTEQQRVLRILASTGAKAAVIDLGKHSERPTGWTSLGDGSRYAIKLPITPGLQERNVHPPNAHGPQQARAFDPS